MSHIEPVRHIEPEVPLDELDPARRDPGYWTRFHHRVMMAVGEELSRRRRAALTMGEVVLSWGRLVLPAATVAAAVAALLVVQPGREPGIERVAALEDLLSVPTDGEEPLPAFLHSDEVVDRDLVLFAVEGF